MTFDEFKNHPTDIQVSLLDGSLRIPNQMIRNVMKLDLTEKRLFWCAAAGLERILRAPPEPRNEPWNPNFKFTISDFAETFGLKRTNAKTQICNAAEKLKQEHCISTVPQSTYSAWVNYAEVIDDNVYIKLSPAALNLLLTYKNFTRFNLKKCRFSSTRAWRVFDLCSQFSNLKGVKHNHRYVLFNKWETAAAWLGADAKSYQDFGKFKARYLNLTEIDRAELKAAGVDNVQWPETKKKGIKILNIKIEFDVSNQLKAETSETAEPIYIAAKRRSAAMAPVLRSKYFPIEVTNSLKNDQKRCWNEAVEMRKALIKATREVLLHDKNQPDTSSPRLRTRKLF
jgi:hypothetical protein